jgi:hypothetical protein
MDYRLADPRGHYRALTRSMARLAGFHKAGKLGPGIDLEFPFDPSRVDVGSRIPYTRLQLDEKVAKLRAFVDEYPQLMPAPLRTREFLDRFALDVRVVLDHEESIRLYLNQQSDYVALCHWNLNLDNAWFWTDANGELQAGLLDWGSVGQMCVAQAFYGMTCSAEIGFLNECRRDLMELFVTDYRLNGGPSIDTDALAHQYRLAVALLGVAWILDAPSLVEAQIPDLHAIKDRYDARLTSNFLARAQLHILTVFLSEWLNEEIGAALRAFSPCSPDRLRY